MEIIREAVEEDAEQLLHIYSYYILKTAVTFEYCVPSAAEFRERIRNTKKKYPYLILEEDGKIAGYSYAGVFKARAAYDRSCEMTIYIDHSQLGRGYGKKLYEAMEKALRDMGILNLYACIAYPEANDEYLTKNSAEFHEHLGYTLAGRFQKCAYKFDRWYDMIWMEKIIGEHKQVLTETYDLPELWEGQREGKGISRKEWENQREVLIGRLKREVYGTEPETVWTVSGKLLNSSSWEMGGKTVTDQILLTVSDNCGRSMDFPVTICLPTGEGTVPVFLWMDFGKKQDQGVKPLEEIIDQGYGIVSFCYEDLAADKEEDEKTQENPMMQTDEKNTWGAIDKWSWGASRVLDYLLTLPRIDFGRIALIGGSRLGKAVLWTAVRDGRFSAYFPVMSGTGGVSCYRKNKKETLEHVITEFPWWWTKDFLKQKDHPEELFFDSHTLLALAAPKPVYVSCGEKDPFVDREAQLKACIEAGAAYEIYGEKGLVWDENPTGKGPYHEGRIGYHIGDYGHFFGRADFNRMIAYREKHHI